jgi:transcription-repair coupling factor (superfamily II helicase)
VAAGNLLGEEQSGHIKEVGFELYQHMLEEAVAEVRGEDEVSTTRLVAADHGRHAGDDPGRLCAGFASRLGLYRRLGEITDIAILTDSVPR